MLRTLFSGLTAAVVVVAGAADCTDPQSLPFIIGATHWNPCYYVSPLPSLVDGAVRLSGLGTRTIKLVLSSDPPYPWNSGGPGVHGPWNLTGVSTLTQLAQHPLYRSVFEGTHGTAYDTFILVTYRYNTGLYFCAPPVTDANMTAEAAEYSELTHHLLTTYAGSGKRFIYQHWEGDWAARCGGYNASAAPLPAVQDGMVRWLAGRQAGTSGGRVAHCTHQQGAGAWAGVDCADEAAVLRAAGVEVYHASEVNLVKASMDAGFPNNILNVIPRVKLDMVSYSAYDTMATPELGKALDFIESHHNKTTASPTPGVYIGEYGLAQLDTPLSALQALLNNVLAYGLSTSPITGARRAAHIQFWELFDNEAPCMPSQRCDGATPVFDPSCLRGFWLVRPNNTESWAWGWLSGVLNGSIPVPTPPAPGDADGLAALAVAHHAPRPARANTFPRGY